MKKLLFLMIILCATASAPLLAHTSSSSPSTYSHPICKGVDFDFTYEVEGYTVRVCGTITSWDEDGPHGTITITVSDDEGSVSADGTFSGKVVENDRPIYLHSNYPEVEQLLFADLRGMSN